ncbi:MAG: DNA ligase D [Burkholderiaceae bacterium]|nr:DNA ligase D [Burkholderiaceae bacterium]
MAKTDVLQPYKSKRDFSITTEPGEGGSANESTRSFVVQKHWASHLHYDFRLELDGTMKSWAVPKGPSLDNTDKRMAVHVEDHPISYNTFEGQIPAKQYGAGKVIIWDKGVWMPLGDARKGYQEGNLKFELHGHKLRGKWVLVRMKGKQNKQDAWLLIKENDEFSRSTNEFSVVDEMPDSVAHLSADKANLPATFKPQLATLVDSPPSASSQWLYEIKFDGYRLLARVKKSRVQLYTRNTNDWTNRLPELAAQLKANHLPEGWYDGEIVMLDEHGLPDFQALQNAFDSSTTKDIVYFLFDLPYCDGMDLRTEPLILRRQKLRELLEHVKGGTIRFSDTFDVPGRDIVASACKLGLEGVIGKKKASHYVSGRSSEWIKLKCGFRQEFVIGGYTDPQGSRTGIGSLLLGIHDAAGALVYVGNVGTGFNAKTLTDIKQKLQALHTTKNPFSSTTGIDEKSHWVKPAMLAEVSFGQWTKNGNVRHAVFHGLRSDKPVRNIIKESPMQTDIKPVELNSLLATLKVTHPERVVDASSNTRKIDLLRYYALVAPLMQEHLKGRPVSLVRAPQGINGQIFFQKHLDTEKMAGVHQLSPKLDPGHDPLMEIVSAQGLLSAAQMNTIELHTWNAVKTVIAKPDRMIFDLDPGEGVEWPAMQEAALVVHAFLNELELESFVKTSGGKGLHVVVPLQRRHDWDTVKDFSHAIVLHLSKTLPTRFSALSGPRNRVGKVFVDYLRNGFGATTVAAWSARARPGMGVSVPIAWDEVKTLHSSAQWRIANIHERLDKGNEPWKDYKKAARTLTAAMKTLSFKAGR